MICSIMMADWLLDYSRRLDLIVTHYNQLSSDLRELRDMLKARYELLLQGIHENVTPEFSR